MYDIQSKSDFSAGASLVVRVPEREIDLKALYTIESDKPDFILPFRHRTVDGQIEFTYSVGNRSKLTYLSGKRSPGEYAELWFGILQPLLDCVDWFMSPYSFVLKPEYLYCDKNSRLINFVYIPSVQACSDYSALKSMITEVAKQNHVTDVELENKVIWAIQDFSPKDFLQMIKAYRAKAVPPPIVQHTPASEPQYKTTPPDPPAYKKALTKPAVEKKTPVMSAASAGTQKSSDDIVINLSQNNKKQREDKSKGGVFGSKREKEAKSQQEPKEKGGLWSKKKTQQQEIIQGAAVAQKQIRPRYEQPSVPVYIPQRDMDNDVTQIDVPESGVPKFRYVGSGAHPRVIEISIAEGGIFTIGRFDVSVGIKQSSFEFDKKTKAVSRRHAVIERDSSGYNIVDLDSSGGTFINGQKLHPNTPFKLNRGCRVSFGHSGADYVWEE